MKRKLLSLSIIICCISLLAAGSLAYFAVEEKTHNVITTSGIDIELQELTEQLDAYGQPLPLERAGGILPGEQSSRIVQVKNNGAQAAYVRIKVAPKIILEKGREGPVDLSLITIDANADAWTFYNGYYYYDQPLAPNGVTKPLLSTIGFSVQMDDLYQNSTVTVDVVAHATQAANNGSSALLAAGWPDDVAAPAQTP